MSPSTQNLSVKSYPWFDEKQDIYRIINPQTDLPAIITLITVCLMVNFFNGNHPFNNKGKEKTNSITKLKTGQIP